MRLRFEKGECGRCGGSGHYSFNGKHDICYQCHGTTESLTRQGSRALAAYDALVKERCTRFIDEIKVGDVIYLPKSHGRKAGWYRATVVKREGRRYPDITFHDGTQLGYAYRAEVILRDLPVIHEIMREVAAKYKGATLVDD